jgi:hypothetical protein
MLRYYGLDAFQMLEVSPIECFFETASFGLALPLADLVPYKWFAGGLIRSE